MEQKPSFGKTLSVTYGAVIVFAVTFILGGILLDKADKEKRKQEKR
ncbi:hypothetical protein [Dictyobacter arantiisoli]|uniref:Uncharacterized protein n=1 Tax=Dictyobacter arantiisoli TaxID=2014874 RepID=A0A5A5TCJ1_9CHLR|nr:hypothetical protein [Dictyobacter arantiisoli]GCF08905.1 hypothetical protein KDI_24690 [Dictyobacter arantiisoli]